MCFALSACTEDGKPLSNIDGAVSGNGTFAVVKGDYLYFVNGVGNSTGNNKMGEVEKGSLLRVKTADVGKENATVETVIPKLVTTGSFIGGIYIYGNTVYYGTPYDGKDKTSTVRNDYTEFRTFDLSTGKASEILYESKTLSKYGFYENGSSVYLAYQSTATVDSEEVKYFNVYDVKGNSVFSVEGYTDLLVADDNSNKVYYTKTAYSEDVKQDEAFNEVYEYVIGQTESKVILSGCGENALARDGRNNAEYKAKILKYSDLAGAQVTLIKNTGKYLIFKVASNDVNLSSYYFALDTAKAVEQGNPIELCESNTYSDVAISSKSYYKSLNEIYYIESSTYLKGLVKYNYADKDEFYGRELISSEADGYNIAYEEAGYLYLSGTSGDYYRIKLGGSTDELTKINAISAKTLTDWFAPRTIGDKFLLVYSEEMYKGYVYAVDMTDENHVEDYSELDRDKVITLSKTIVGKMTSDDKDSFESLVDSAYPAEEDQE